MRAIDSAIALSSALEKDLLVYWTRTKNLDCRFHSLFQSIALPHVTVCDINSARAPGWKTSGKQIRYDKVIEADELDSSLDSGNKFKELRHYSNILMESFSRFYINEKMYSNLVPTKEIRRLIDLECENFTNNTIGIHIRRTDHVWSVRESPTEMFVDAMRLELSLNDKTNFYVASDCLETKQYLGRVFAEKVLTNFQKAERKTESGMIRAVIELYTLSRTSKIYGSYRSTFSHTAAHLSAIEEIPVARMNLSEFRKTDKEKAWQGYFDHEIERARSSSILSTEILEEDWKVSGQAQVEECILPYIDQASVVLEIACGLGRVSRFVAPQCKQLFCTDIIDNALEEARINLSGMQNIKYRKINGFDLKRFDRNQFDLVFSFGTFFHLDFEVVVNYLIEIKRVLKPKGFCMLEFKSFKSEKDIELLLKKIKKGGIERHESDRTKFRYVTSDMLKTLCDYLELNVITEDVYKFTLQK